MDLKIEGSAGVALAACAADSDRRGDKKAAVLVCGGNIADDQFFKVVQKGK